MSLDEITALRDQVWDVHPIICERAVLPTLALKDVVGRVWNLGRKGRGSIAFYALPLSGKSSCADAIVVEMKRKKPGCGVLIFEVVGDKNQAEGRLLSEILNQINYAPKISRDLAGKRTQVHRALLALSGGPRHLFLIFDEAQELTSNEYAWLKSVINRLVRDTIKVTVILFGQVELKEKGIELRAARSDLEQRFMSTLNELNSLRSAKEALVPVEAIDENSEYPAGSRYTYTQLLLPKFYAAGGRLKAHHEDIWTQLKIFRNAGTVNVVPMNVFASFIASLFILLRELDSAELVITPELLRKVPMGQ